MVIAAGVVAMVVLEVVVFVQVLHLVGVLPTVALLVVVPLLGARVCKREGLAVVGRVREQVACGRLPGADLAAGLWIFVAGVLLVVPGFVTDAVGLALLLPPVRAVANRWVGAALVRRIASSA